MIKAVFFDLDGTLVNSIFDIAAGMNRALAELHLPGWPVEDYYRKVGNGARKLCQRALPADRQELTDVLLPLYNAQYLAHCREKTVPYEGTAEMLASLRAQGLKLAVITNKPRSQTEQVITLLPDGVLDAVFGQQEPFPVKPDPASFRHVAALLDVLPEECLYCGDSDVDVRFAHNAGAKAIGCVWGFRGERELREAGAEYLAESPQALAELVKNLLA